MKKSVYKFTPKRTEINLLEFRTLLLARGYSESMIQEIICITDPAEREDVLIMIDRGKTYTDIVYDLEF